MLKRLIVASVIFLVEIAVLMLPILIGIYRGITRERATGIAFVLGSATENVFRIVVLLILAILAYWLSGRLVKV
jgi:hypothetical protein